MHKHYVEGLVGVGRRTLLLAVTGIVVPLASLGSASTASAANGEYAAFAQCPVGTPGVEGCLVSRTESGEIVIGNKKTAVPIVKTQTVQGGFGEVSEETGQSAFFGATNGETLSKTPQRVPGGLLGLSKCDEMTGNGLIGKILRATCESIFENSRVTGVNAVTELAAPASSIYLNEFALNEQLPYPPYPPALVLPVKIHLENALLGPSCYIGSSTEPIELAFTTGTTSPPTPNQPIKGKLGKLSSRGKGRILVITENSLVGNAFAVPKASGCGLLGLLDGMVDSKLGLPSPAGENTAVLNNTVEQASASAVEESGE